MKRRGGEQPREKSVKEESYKTQWKELKHLNPEENCKEETTHDPNGSNRVEEFDLVKEYKKDYIFRVSPLKIVNIREKRNLPSASNILCFLGSSKLLHASDLIRM